MSVGLFAHRAHPIVLIEVLIRIRTVRTPYHRAHGLHLAPGVSRPSKWWPKPHVKCVCTRPCSGVRPMVNAVPIPAVNPNFELTGLPSRGVNVNS